MAATTFQKVSGVLIITQTTGYGAYYGATAIAEAKFKPSNDGTLIYLTIGNDSYTIAYGDVRVGTSVPTTMSSALVLLNSIIGT